MVMSKKLKTTFLFLLVIFSLHLNSIPAIADPCFQGFPTMTGNIEYVFQWDPKNPDEIDRNSSETISVIHGSPNFQWEISGEGFWFDAEHTMTEIQSSKMIDNRWLHLLVEAYVQSISRRI